MVSQVYYGLYSQVASVATAIFRSNTPFSSLFITSPPKTDSPKDEKESKEVLARSVTESSPYSYEANSPALQLCHQL